MKLAHFIITLFCFRGKDAFKHLYWPGSNFDVSPLEISFLTYRLKLFKMLCLPGILSQTNQDFSWIIIIDRDIDPNIRHQIEELVNKRERSIIVEYNENIKLEKTAWLEPYFIQSPDYILTTNHDDDDILPASYTKHLHNHIRDCVDRDSLPGVKFIGAKQIIQWDLISTKESFFGWVAPWHRGDFPSSCGFSLISQYPRTDISVMGLLHRRVERYTDFIIEPENKHDELQRQRILSALSQCDESERSWKKEDLFYDISQKTGPVIMSNHARNAQYARLYETKPEYVKVVGKESFEGFHIDWDQVQEHMPSFTQDRPYYLKRKLEKSLYKLHRKLMRIAIRIYRRLIP